MESLGDRMKEYEKQQLHYIQSSEPFIVRLDGNSFSKFTKQMKKPFDDNFLKAMCLTTGDLLDKFNPSTAYTHSDEITLIFPPALTKEEIKEGITNKNHLFNGKHSKIISLTSSYCSIRFNYHLMKLMNEHKTDYPQKYIDLINEQQQIFDARILTFNDKPYEIVNHQIWRSIYDCHRNAVSTYADSYYSHKETEKKNTQEKIKMLEEKGLLWNDVPLYYKHGVYCKKDYYMKETENGLVQRTMNKYICFKIDFNDVNEKLLLSKTLSNSEFKFTNFEEITDFVCH
jgi:tRNA(His) 5'-end guanylyltransferase